MDEAEALDQAAKRYNATKEAHENARDLTVEAAVAALRAGLTPTEVTNRSPFSAAYVRRIARDNGIGAAKPGPKRAGRR